MRVRRIRADESTLLRAVRLAALTDTPTAFGGTLQEASSHPGALWRERAERAAEGGAEAVFLAEAEGQVVGMVGGNTPSSTPDERVLFGLWVEPGYRKLGTGASLVEALCDWAEEAGALRVRLMVAEPNHAARRLYARLGFTETGRTQPLASHPQITEQEMVRVLAKGAIDRSEASVE